MLVKWKRFCADIKSFPTKKEGEEKAEGGAKLMLRNMHKVHFNLVAVVDFWS